ncbi:DUF6186 family protein [Geodermatophilus sp. YIM 151500]|uniref:DUF6186 family protein n=1 Tax=Geodermatophilus sp. YIM 151500 TaxID=2984531 RepID=UPI0021E49A37|nr:DUF6186 family protein [Geodermatophilus sp. YIM 151500]MCV2487763.1 DUF6186 family protein [Geodermatophilus sp. YIM 151500]
MSAAVGTAVSVAVFAVLLVAAVALEAGARRAGRWPTATEAVAAAMRTGTGRFAVLLVWLWLGVHFLAR